MENEFAEKKKALRALLRQRRSDAAKREPRAPFALRDVFLDSVKVPTDTCFAVYMAQGDEMDPAPLVEALWQRGHRFCLPVVERKGQPLAFRAYCPGDSLRIGPMDILEPFTSSPIVQPDIILAPLLGFNWKGHRLGQGGGFYDRTLATLRAKQRPVQAIGLAYAVQEENELYAGPNDEKLDAIVTEIEYFKT